MTPRNYRYVFFFCLFIIAVALMFLVVKPYIQVVFLAFVIAVVFKNYHEWLLRKTGSEFTAAGLSVVSVIGLILIPLAVITILLFFEARNVYANLAAFPFNDQLLALEQRLDVYLPGINIDISQYVRSGLDWVISNTASLFGSLFKIVLDMVIMLFALFYLFKDGKKLREYFVAFSPLDTEDDLNILKKLELTINSVVRGSLIIAIIQGTLITLGFTIFGVSKEPVLWGVVASLASLVPGLGTALVSVPAIAILAFQGNLTAAIGLAVWAAIMVGSVDNFLSPHLIKRRVNIHPLFILISVLGGLAFFGPIGLLAGPITLTFALELLKLYPKFVNRNDIA